jgi:hypothetical protein
MYKILQTAVRKMKKKKNSLKPVMEILLYVGRIIILLYVGRIIILMYVWRIIICGEDYNHINRFSSASFLCLSEARSWISNIICQ